MAFNSFDASTLHRVSRKVQENATFNIIATNDMCTRINYDNLFSRILACVKHGGGVVGKGERMSACSAVKSRLLSRKKPEKSCSLPA